MCRNVVCLDCKRQFVLPVRRGPIPKRCETCRRAVDALRSKTANRKKANSGYLRVCVHCNKQWLARHPKSKFCSRSCQYLASGGRVIVACEQCQQPFNTTLKRKKEGHRFCGKACMRQARQPDLRSCIECGKNFRRSPKGANGKNDKALFCSKPCYFAARNAGRVAWDRTNQMKAVWHRRGPYASAPSARLMRRIAKAHAVIEKTGRALLSMAGRELNRPACERCGGPCKDGASRFCSYKCNKEWRGDRQCRCGAIVSRCTAFGPPPACKECRRKARREWRVISKDTRKRVRRGGGYWNPKLKAPDVFKRDNWTCYMCKAKCEKVYDPMNPLSATVDHVYPVAAGGDHDWHNVRTACAACNAKKGDRIQGQRLLRLR